MAFNAVVGGHAEAPAKFLVVFPEAQDDAVTTWARVSTCCAVCEDFDHRSGKGRFLSLKTYIGVD